MTIMNAWFDGDGVWSRSVDVVRRQKRDAAARAAIARLSPQLRDDIGLTAEGELAEPLHRSPPRGTTGR